MTTLRAAAQQALEALEVLDRVVLSRHAQEAITALRAALAEPALQTCNCRWDGEMQMQQCTLHEAHVDAIKEWAQRAKFAEKKLAALAEQRLTDMEQKMERSIESLKAALAEPVQEPVAWIHTDPDKRRVKFLEWRENEPGYRGDWIKTPLYAAPPQRKPLTEEEIREIFFAEIRALPSYPSAIEELPERLARAIERAHGIGDKDVHR